MGTTWAWATAAFHPAQNTRPPAPSASHPSSSDASSLGPSHKRRLLLSSLNPNPSSTAAPTTPPPEAVTPEEHPTAVDFAAQEGAADSPATSRKSSATRRRMATANTLQVRLPPRPYLPLVL